MCKNTRPTYLIFFIILSFTALLQGCALKEVQKTPVKKQFFALDTLITITLYNSKAPSPDYQTILDSCEKLCGEYESLLSRTKEGSDVYELNHAGARSIAVSESTFYLIKESIKYSGLTDGLFDVTIAPALELWGFGDEEINEIPDGESLREALSHVSYENISLNESENTVALKDPEAAIDLGACAKGYIADRLKEYLVEQGITSAVIDLGGNILTIGNKPDGTPFNIAIKAPFSNASSFYAGNPLSGESIAASIAVAGRSVVTSGIYERYKLIGGKMYHHVLNPFTGYPADNSLASVTIISDSSLTGDLLSTSCLLLGKEGAKSLISGFPDIQAIFIEKDGTITSHPLDLPINIP